MLKVTTRRWLRPHFKAFSICQTRPTVKIARPTMRLLLFISMISLGSFFWGCDSRYSYYLVGTMEQSLKLRELFQLLDKEEEVGENRFIVIQQIVNHLLTLGKPEKLVLFLTTYVEQNPRDPYNGYYLGLVAAAYRDLEALPMAVHYYERILMNYPDLLVSGSSLHYRCLQELVSLVDDPRAEIEYYKELIARFSYHIDLGASYYFLAKSYEEVGEWEQAIRVYQKFLKYPNTEITGFPNAHVKIKEKVAFYYAGKEWTVENLGYLVGEIQLAIATRDARRLLRYKAKVNFFTKSWAQAEADESLANVFDIGAFLSTSPRIIVDSRLDIDSNSGEAFLRTHRWSYLAMNFTGTTPFTSPTGVEKEMRRFIPVQAGMAVLGVMLWIGSAF